MNRLHGGADTVGRVSPMGAGPASEQALIASARAGDPSAFNALARTYQDTAYAVAYGILGHPDSAADMVQDALLSAYRALPAFRSGSFRAWLLRIVVNACYDLMRTAAHRRQSYLEDTAGNSEHAPVLIDQSADPEEAILRHETMQAIEAGIARLPHNQRLVLLLSDLQGFGYDEIAQVTGASPGAVKSRLSRARHSLRTYLTRELAPVGPAPGLPPA